MSNKEEIPQNRTVLDSNSQAVEFLKRKHATLVALVTAELQKRGCADPLRHTEEVVHDAIKMFLRKDLRQPSRIRQLISPQYGGKLSVLASVVASCSRRHVERCRLAAGRPANLSALRDDVRMPPEMIGQLTAAIDEINASRARSEVTKGEIEQLKQKTRAVLDQIEAGLKDVA